MYHLRFLLLLSLFFASELVAEQPQRTSFINDVVPILTKAGCNAGVCHAKAGGGQNGFELSLLGFEPELDYRHLVYESRGRRLFPLDPKQSLLLTKATAQAPHGGGVRLKPDSPEYQTILQWIQSGSPYQIEDDRQLASITVEPASGILQRGASVQLKTIAHYTDGSTRDVTRDSLFESNNIAMAEVTDQGTVTAAEIPGNVSIMVRYLGQVSVYNGAIPLGIKNIAFPANKNFVDELVFQNLERLGIPATKVCDDGTFLRRVSLDITGRLPTARETQAFLDDQAPNKRDTVVDRLLASAAYADFFANKWAAVLKNRRDDTKDIKANFAFHAWLRDNLLAGTPYDQMVRQLLAATGTIVANPPVAWYKRVKEPKQQIEDLGQLFLGVRLQCAQCHHHPFERWSQDDYYSLAAFFSQVGRKPTDTAGEDLIFHKRGVAQATNMKTGKPIAPRALGDDVGEIPADEDPRLRLADWMASPKNPFFAKALVNRYWKHFFSRGLVEPEDDIRDTNPASNPELLAALERHFLDSDYDLRELIRVIVKSNAYQLDAIPLPDNKIDRQNYSRYYPKRLQAEVLLDAIDQVAGSSTSFTNLPLGTRAVALPDNSYNKSSPFLKVFGRPEAASVCECERVQSGSLAQSLHLMNANDIKSKLRDSKGRIQQWITDKAELETIIDQLYLAAYARLPLAEERRIASEHLRTKADATVGQQTPSASELRSNLQDLAWALINTKEFLFNH